MKNKDRKKIKEPKTVPKIQNKKKFEYKFIGLILLVGLALRLTFFFELKSTPMFESLYSDSKIFSDLAWQIINNNSWFGKIIFYMSPGYTYFLAILYSVFGHDLALIRIIQILINTANIFIIYLIGRELFSIKAGYAAAILASVFSIFIFYSSVILLEVIFAFFISLLLYHLVRTDKPKDRSYWLTAGIFLGAAALFRGNILLFLPVLILWLIIKNRTEQLKVHFESAGFLTIGVLLLIIPITINNYIAEKKFLLLTSNAGINFYIGNHEKATGIYKIPEHIDFHSDPTGKKYAELESGKELSAAEVSDFWMNKGFDFIGSSLPQASLLTLKKFFLFFDDAENPQSSIMDISFYAENYSFLLKLPLPGFYFIFLFALAGLVLSFNKNEKHRITYLLIAAYTVSIIIFFVVGRFRVGITPVLIVFAGYGIVEIYELIKQYNFKKLIIPAAAAAVFIAVNLAYIPAYSFDDSDAYINLGNTSFSEGDYNKALNYYNQALEIREESGTYVLIGNTLAVKKDVAGAFRAYVKSIELDTDNFLAHYNFGILFVQTGRYDKAMEAFLTTIEINPSYADAYRNMAIIQYMQENYEASLLLFEKYLYFSNDDEAKVTVKRDIEEIKKKLNE
jgi:4-amino-4-deoxy-L-arabinose transferase-like glycosyltransferase